MIIARIVILMGILAPTLPAWGQVYVPDDSFELFLHSNGHGFGTPDDNLVANSVATISVLDIHDLGIADLTGVQAVCVEYFPDSPPLR